MASNEGLTVSEIALGSVIEQALGIVRRHHLQLPHELALLLKAGVDAAQLGAQLPDHVRRLLETLERGEFEAHLRADELEPLVARAERLGNRLVAGVIAAFINGLAELAAADPGRRRARERPMFTFGLGAAGTLGGYLAWTSRRGTR